MSGAHPCVHTRGCGDRLVVITSPVEPRRVGGNVAGESPWLRGDIYRCAGHDLGDTSPVMTTTQW